jgi:hypothetical protein
MAGAKGLSSLGLDRVTSGVSNQFMYLPLLNSLYWSILDLLLTCVFEKKILKKWHSFDTRLTFGTVVKTLRMTYLARMQYACMT